MGSPRLGVAGQSPASSRWLVIHGGSSNGLPGWRESSDSAVPDRRPRGKAWHLYCCRRIFSGRRPEQSGIFTSVTGSRVANRGQRHDVIGYCSNARTDLAPPWGNFSFVEAQNEYQESSRTTPENLTERLRYRTFVVTRVSACPSRDVSIEFLPGKMTAVVGPSGLGSRRSSACCRAGGADPARSPTTADRWTHARQRCRSAPIVVPGAALTTGSIMENIPTGPRTSLEERAAAAERVGLLKIFGECRWVCGTVISDGAGLCQVSTSTDHTARVMAMRDPKMVVLMRQLRLSTTSRRQALRILGRARATRIVVALSLVDNPDTLTRLSCLIRENVETGTYDELIERGELFCLTLPARVGPTAAR